MSNEIIILNYKKTYERTAKFDKFIDSERRVGTYFSLIKNCPGKKILEIGCAKGTLAIKLAKSGYNVTAIDVAEKYIDKAKNNARKNKVNIRFIVMDIERPVINEFFDIIVMTEVLEHVRSPSIVLENVWNLLKKDGFLIVSTPNQCTLGNLARNLFKKDFFQGLHLNCYDFSQLQYILKLHGFKTLKLYTAEEIDFPFLNRIHFLKRFSLYLGKKLPTLSKQLIIKAQKSKPFSLENAILSDWENA